MSPTTTRSGVPIHYSVEGDGPALVLLHGLATSSELWRLSGHVDALRDAFRVVLVDARGHGLSGRPTDVAEYAIASHVADVIAVMDDAGVETAVHVGFSMGGETALSLAAVHPRRTTGIITIGSEPTAAAFEDVPMHDPAGALAGAERYESTGVSWLADILDSEGRAAFAALVRRADATAMARQLRALAAPSGRRGKLSAVRAPALMIWGEHEKPDPLPQMPERAETLIIPGADHAGTLEAVDQVLPAITDFAARFGRQARR